MKKKNFNFDRKLKFIYLLYKNYIQLSTRPKGLLGRGKRSGLHVTYGPKIIQIITHIDPNTLTIFSFIRLPSQRSRQNTAFTL